MGTSVFFFFYGAGQQSKEKGKFKRMEVKGDDRCAFAGLRRRKKAIAMKSHLSLSLSPGQSSPRKAAERRRAAPPKQLRGSEPLESRGEGSLRGAEKTKLLSLHLKKEKVAALVFFLDLLLSFFSSSNSSSFSFLFFVMFCSTLQDYIVLLFFLSGSDSRPLM